MGVEGVVRCLERLQGVCLRASCAGRILHLRELEASVVGEHAQRAHHHAVDLQARLQRRLLLALPRGDALSQTVRTEYLAASIAIPFFITQRYRLSTMT